MRRRQKLDDARYPRRLVEYRAEDWTGTGCHPECAYWDAVSEWQSANPDADLPHVERGPDAPWHPELI